MHASYDDIISRISTPPIWYDDTPYRAIAPLSLAGLLAFTSAKLLLPRLPARSANADFGGLFGCEFPKANDRRADP